jgi:hypothetical protein
MRQSALCLQARHGGLGRLHLKPEINDSGVYLPVRHPPILCYQVHATTAPPPP